MASELLEIVQPRFEDFQDFGGTEPVVEMRQAVSITRHGRKFLFGKTPGQDLLLGQKKGNISVSFRGQAGLSGEDMGADIQAGLQGGVKIVVSDPEKIRIGVEFVERQVPETAKAFDGSFNEPQPILHKRSVEIERFQTSLSMRAAEN